MSGSHENSNIHTSFPAPIVSLPNLKARTLLLTFFKIRFVTFLESTLELLFQLTAAFRTSFRVSSADSTFLSLFIAACSKILFAAVALPPYELQISANFFARSRICLPFALLSSVRVFNASASSCASHSGAVFDFRLP